MRDFIQKMQYGPRKIAVTGHFGSGKTEFAVSLAFALAHLGAAEERLALCDLDIENPYFRSREQGAALEEAGIRCYSDPFGGRNGSELQTISAAVRAPLEDEGCRVIVDCGGDNSGAMVLRQFQKYFTPGEYQLLCVVNQNRPGTDTPEKAVAHLRAIEEASGLAVTGLVSNSHLIRYTTAETVTEGWEFAKEVETLSGVPALCACCMESIAPQLKNADFDVFPIGMYMRDTYLDKQV
ncbi:MAG: ATP-binding protein [Oscillospiraceae bacterium]|nr:ATP-binding protein [Oscillospiraceae bacterium]